MAPHPSDRGVGGVAGRPSRCRIVAASVALVAIGSAGCGSDHPRTRTQATTGTTTTAASRTAAGMATDPANRRRAADYRRRTANVGRPVLLERSDPVAVAGGDGYAAWIADDHVVVRAPGRAPQELDRSLPPGTNQLAIGTGRDGRVVVVLASSDEHTPLHVMPADGSADAAPLPFSGPSDADSAPGIADGTVSFSRLETVDGRARHVVRTGRIGARTSTRLWNGAAHTSVTRTVPTRGGAAFVTSDDAYEFGASHTLRLVGRGTPARRLEGDESGELAPADFGALQVTVDGTRFDAVRWTDDQRTHPWDVATYRAPSGELLSRRHTGSAEGNWGVEVQDGRIFADMDRAQVGDTSGEGQLVFLRAR